MKRCNLLGRVGFEITHSFKVRTALRLSLSSSAVMLSSVACRSAAAVKATVLSHEWLAQTAVRLQLTRGGDTGLPCFPARAVVLAAAGVV